MKMFSAKEEEILDYILFKAGDDESGLDLEELHGFFFGLAVTPELIAYDEWMPIVFGKGGPVFDDEEDERFCVESFIAVYKRIISDVDRGKLRFPFNYEKMSDDDFGLIEDWTYGLFLALTMRPNIWGMSEKCENMDNKDIPEDLSNVIHSCGLITAIAFPYERPNLFIPPPDQEPKSEDDIEATLYGVLPLCVETIQQYGEKLRREMPPGSACRTLQQKIGRNDPCPCGSGKKYKKCCKTN